MRAVRHFGTFRGVNARGWLLAITRNACWTLLEKRRGRLSEREFDEALHSPELESAGPEADVARVFAAADVRRAVDGLPFVFREAIVLREIEDLSYREIAEVTGAPVGTVMSRLARARALLARALAPERRPT